MLYWTFQVILFSIIFILLVHHIIDFLKSTLTVTKVKDLVNTRNQKYENIYNIVSNNSQINQPIQQTTQQANQFNYSLEDLLPKPDPPEQNMKSELKNFLKSQLNNDTTEISAL
jgi:hypothetical protein